ncbi:MAG: hydroxyacylglutathione hydrolase [Rhodocyclaceae bacterium]|jgi:hydroxyacylglutathione hydrolase|nr:hydroxyacylglutathione hydrolase [Rhodocyclaceae bacterium]
MEIIGLRAFTDNYIWILRDRGYAVAVDPGDAAPVIEYLKHSGDTLSALLLTHHHPDHVGGVAPLLERAEIPVFGPAAENIAGVNRPLHGGETLSLPGLASDFTVVPVPGHTRGHVAYYRPNVLLCGDALFTLGCGRLFEGTPAQMFASLQRIAALPPETMIYCAHEYTRLNLPFALSVEPDNATLQQRATQLQQSIADGKPTVPMRLADELATNPFLRMHSRGVIATARRNGADEAAPVTEIFAAIRRLRDGFKPPTPPT